MSICKNCGNQINENEKFCSNCGEITIYNPNFKEGREEVNKEFLELEKKLKNEQKNDKTDKLPYIIMISLLIILIIIVLFLIISTNKSSNNSNNKLNNSNNNSTTNNPVNNTINNINNAEQVTAKNSAMAYVSSIENYISMNQLAINESYSVSPVQNIACDIVNPNETCKEWINALNKTVRGMKPTSGTITINGTNIVVNSLTFNGYTFSTNDLVK